MDTKKIIVCGGTIGVELGGMNSKPFGARVIFCHRLNCSIKGSEVFCCLHLSR